VGEAKRRARWMAGRQHFSRPMKPARFNLLAIGSRLSPTRLVSEERSYWSDTQERVLGLVFRDKVDNDFGWILFARDKIGRFRCADLKVSLDSETYAVVALRERIAIAVESGDFLALGDQGDETNYPVDLLQVPVGTDPQKFHPHFRHLLETSGRTPARAVLKEIGPWLAPSDPHFVSEFQFTQFDQRLWELYLWSAFRELGFDIRQPEAPDFLCSAPGIAFTVEATTVSPSQSGPLAIHPDPRTPEEMQEFLTNYMPMKFGSTLVSKLNKKNKAGESYWERGETANKPFILAIADFHKTGGTDEAGSMVYTQSALWPYLYGHRIGWEMIDGELVTKVTKNSPHVYGDKIIPSGFFDLPGAENVSAVLFSNAGTLAKFDRMGVSAGFAPKDCQYFRMGIRSNPDPNAVHGVPFSVQICAEDYEEFWSDELQIFHNPNAKHPLSPDDFFGITQHFFKDGDHYSIVPDGTILASRTLILQMVGGDEDETIV
jgi:hypothetical protein